MSKVYIWATEEIERRERHAKWLCDCGLVGIGWGFGAMVVSVLWLIVELRRG